MAETAAGPGPVRLSVVIPTAGPEPTLAACLEGLRLGRAWDGEMEIVLAVAGDERAAAAGVRIVASASRRGLQLGSGARAARGAWLLFVHADTVLAPGWADEAAAFMTDPANTERAATFRFALDDRSGAARRLEAMVAWRCRALGLPYGDQGLLISRAFYDRLGGFAHLPLMEDVAFVRRIGRTRLHFFETAALTSAARYRRAGYIRRSARNLGCLALYFLGVPPRLIVRLYG